MSICAKQLAINNAYEDLSNRNLKPLVLDFIRMSKIDFKLVNEHLDNILMQFLKCRVHEDYVMEIIMLNIVNVFDRNKYNDTALDIAIKHDAHDRVVLGLIERYYYGKFNFNYGKKVVKLVEEKNASANVIAAARDFRDALAAS
jgi:hypothetical protein